MRISLESGDKITVWYIVNENNHFRIRIDSVFDSENLVTNVLFS